MNRTSFTINLIIILILMLYVSLGATIYIKYAYQEPDIVTVNDNYDVDKNILGKNPEILRMSAKVIYALDSPMKGLDQIMDWGAAQGTMLFTTNFQNYYSMYEKASSGFTPKGWKSLMNQLVESGLFEAVVEKKLASTAIVSRPPVLLRQGLLNGRWTWRIQFEMLVNYESASELKQVKYITTMMIVRVPADKMVNNSGLAVDSLSVRKV